MGQPGTVNDGMCVMCIEGHGRCRCPASV